MKPWYYQNFYLRQLEQLSPVNFLLLLPTIDDRTLKVDEYFFKRASCFTAWKVSNYRVGIFLYSDSEKTSVIGWFSSSAYNLIEK